MINEDDEPYRGVRGLPVPRLEPVMSAGAVSFHSTTVDDRGRVGVLAPLRELGWSTGSVLSCRLVDGVIAVSPSPPGGNRIGRRGYLRIPAPLRHRCRLAPGSRVLVVARRGTGLLEIHPSASVEAWLQQRVPSST